MFDPGGRELPLRRDAGREHAVARFGEGRELVPDEAGEGRVRGLQDEQIPDPTPQATLFPVHDGGREVCLGAGTSEGDRALVAAGSQVLPVGSLYVYCPSRQVIVAFLETLAYMEREVFQGGEIVDETQVVDEVLHGVCSN